MPDAASLIIRLARRSDVPALVSLFADDALGGHGDTSDPLALPNYEQAFDLICASPNEDIYVAERSGLLVGTFQLAILTKLTGQGSRTLMLLSVQTRSDLRGQGIGAQMIEFAIDFAKQQGLDAVQLMSNAKRIDAHRFYQRLGFSATHTGFRMELNSSELLL